MLSDEGKESPRSLTSKSAYLALLYALPILLIFAYLGDFYRGIGAAICAGLIMLVMMTRWDLRKRVWFWIAITFAGFLQVPLVLFIPWKNRNLTAISLLPVAVLDYAIVYGCIKLAEKVMTRSDGAASAG